MYPDLTKQKGEKSKEEGNKNEKGDTVSSGGQKGQNKRAEVEEEGKLASALPPYASLAAAYRQTFCLEVWREVRLSCWDDLFSLTKQGRDTISL